MTTDESSTDDKPSVEPTPDEIKNGWTKESLNRYLAERDQQAADVLLRNERRKRARIESTQSFNPHKW